MDATDCEINYLEHVELEINIEYPYRGDLEIYLTSSLGKLYRKITHLLNRTTPKSFSIPGTQIQLLSRRQNDNSNKGFQNWKLMSVLTWNENPRGPWKALVTDQVSP